MSLADRIRERLERVGKSASGASLEAGLSRSAIQDILSGSSASPRLDTLLKLAKPLQCSIQYLVSDEPDASAPPPSNYRDLRMDTVVRDIENGVFRRDWPADRQKQRADAEAGIISEFAVSDDPRMPGQDIELYRLGDHSMTEAGIFKGDILHVLVSRSEHTVLFDGQIVLIHRHLNDGKLSEFAVRQVAHRGDGIDLIPRSLSGDFDMFTIPHTTYGSPNSYLMEDGWLDIEGTVSGIYRELPVASDGNILHPR